MNVASSFITLYGLATAMSLSYLTLPDYRYRNRIKQTLLAELKEGVDSKELSFKLDLISRMYKERREIKH